MIDTPRLVDADEQPAAVIHLTIPRSRIGEAMGPAIQELVRVAGAQGVGPAGPVFSHHFRVDPQVFDFEVGVPVSAPVREEGRVRAGVLPAARVVRTVYRGGYEGLAEAWGAFDAWVQREGHGVAGPLWERYLKGPESGSDATLWETELNFVLR